MWKIAIFSSGNGSNFEKIVSQSFNKNYQVEFLFCDRKDAFVFERAKSLGIKSFYLSILKEKENFDIKILQLLEEHKIDLIVLAGYMKIISPRIVKKYPNRIINTHPSLLPKYPGKDAITRAFEAKESVFGITIHFVDFGIDTGKIIYQESFEKKNLTFEQIEVKIHALEHKTYSKVIEQVLNNL